MYTRLDVKISPVCVSEPAGVVKVVAWSVGGRLWIFVPYIALDSMSFVSHFKDGLAIESISSYRG